MAKQYRVRLGMHSLAPHFFAILPSWVFQPSSLPAFQLRKLSIIYIIIVHKRALLDLINFIVKNLSVPLCWLNSGTFVSSINVHKKCTLPDFEEWYQKPLFVLKTVLTWIYILRTFSGQVGTNLYLCRAVCLSHGTHTTNQWLWPVALTYIMIQRELIEII